jgi:hypothetical protein
MLDMFIYFVGFCTISVIFVTLIFLSIKFGFKKDSYLLFTIFDFGLIYTYDNSASKEKLNLINKSEDKNWFITAPKWFNKYVWNFGVK